MNNIYIDTSDFATASNIKQINIEFKYNAKPVDLSRQTVKIEYESITANFTFDFNGLKCSGTYTSSYETQEQITERIICSLLPKAKYKPFDYRSVPATPCCDADKQKISFNPLSGAMQCVACGQIYELIAKEESTDEDT